jgi:hypothetical protein
MIVETYQGYGDYADRTAEIHVHEYQEYNYVKMYKGGENVEIRVLKGKSLQYAQDTAENWITGVING